MIEGTLDIPELGREPSFALDDPLLVAAAWSRLTEPGDMTAGGLVNAVGAGPALGWVFASVGGEAHARRSVAALCAHLGADDSAARRLTKALTRWEPRLAALDPERDLAHLTGLGGSLLVPGTAHWPPGLDDLGNGRPHCLWLRGSADIAGSLSHGTNRSVALVGSRACTDYGTGVTHEMASGLADRDFLVVSGGAYGIDAAAHRGALAARGQTIALLAGGVDRLYPAGNARLLRAVCEENGAVMSEVPPGAVPSRSRFLQRNRLIAALARATVVVEAAWRSGALSTAGHAATMMRPVGAVPGPVTSAASAGAHRLLREQGAVCVTDAAEVAELAGDLGSDAVPERTGERAEYDDLAPVARLVYDALPLRGGSTPEAIARVAGLSAADVLAGLGELELAGIAKRAGSGWKR